MNTKRYILIITLLAIAIITIILLSIDSSKSLIRDSTLRFNDAIDIPPFIPFKSDSKWGLYDHKKQVVIKPVYETENWNNDPDGYIIDSRNGLFGLIDSTAKKIIPFIYDEISRSENNQNHFIVKRGSQFGVINSTNEIVIPIMYSEISRFNKYYVIEGWKNGNTFVNIVDQLGNTIFENVSHDFNMLSQDSLITVYVKINKREDRTSLGNPNYRLGCIDLKGRFIIPPKFTEIENNGRYFIVSDYSNEESRYSVFNNQNEGVCNNKGILIIPTIYDDIRYNKKNNIGIFICRKADGVKVLDSLNKVIIPEKYQYIFSPNYINNQINFIVEFEQVFGLINSIGEIIIPFEYSFLFDPYDSGLIAARRKMKAGFLDYQNNEIITFKYDNVKPFRENRAAVKLIEQDYIKGNYMVTNKISNNGIGKLYYYLSNNRNTPDEFKSFFFNKEDLSKSLKQPEFRESFYYKYQPYLKRYSCFEEFDLCMTLGNWEDLIKGKWGFIDTTGKEITDCIYDEVTDFEDGYAEVKLNNKWGVINIQGKIVIPIKYDSISRAFYNKYKDLFRVYKHFPNSEYDKFVGYVDTNGTEYFDN